MKKSELLKEYEEAVKNFNAKTHLQFEEIYRLLDLIKETSEQTGVPFQFEIGDVARQYIPEKYSEIVGQIEDEWPEDSDEYCADELADLIGFYPNADDSDGGDWEEWNSSSLSC